VVLTQKMSSGGLDDGCYGESRQRDIEIDDVYYCPHHRGDGLGNYRRDRNCRKPGPEMSLRAAKERSVGLQHSILAGDKATDIAVGRVAGRRSLHSPAGGAVTE